MLFGNTDDSILREEGYVLRTIFKIDRSEETQKVITYRFSKVLMFVVCWVFDKKKKKSFMER